MILDFSFQQVMRLSSIKRWAVIEMSRDQSVAEHSYNVAMISMALIDKITSQYPGAWTRPRQEILHWALVHDLPELVTGDLPTPIKAHIGSAVNELEEKLFPKYSKMKESMERNVDLRIAQGIVKAADWIDAIQYAEKYCVDSRRNEIIDEMRLKLHLYCNDFDVKFGMILQRTVDELWHA